MVKGMIFSDLHIHKHKNSVDRLEHCIEALNWIFLEAKKNKCKYIFFLGDLFHDQAKIDVHVYTRAFETIASHMQNSDLHMYLLVGNHDMYHRERWDINSLKPLNCINGVTIIDKPTKTEIEGLKIDWLPHVKDPIDELNHLRQDIGDVLFSHLSVNGATLNACHGTKADVIVEHDGEMLAVDAGLFSDWKQVFLGHYHGEQKLTPTVEYVGSPLQLSMGEAFQKKHIILYDLNTREKEYIVNEFSPKHLIISSNDVEYETYDLNNNFVRISVENMGKSDLIDLKDKVLNNYKVLSFDIKQADKKVEEDLQIISDAKSIMHDVKEMLSGYLKDRGVPDNLNKDRLLKTGFRCLEV